MARTKPPLKLRRGTQAEITAAFASNPADFAEGEPVFATDTGKLYIKNAAGTLEEISGTAEAAATWGQIVGTLANQTDLNNALAAKVNESDLPQDGSGNLDIAQESTLQAFSTQVSSLQSSVNSLGYLSTYFTDAALPSAPTTTGFLQYDSGTSAWSLVTSTATAPTEINGGNATSFGD